MCGALTQFPISLSGEGLAQFIGTTDRERLVSPSVTSASSFSSFAMFCSKYRGWMGLALKGYYFPQACQTSPGIVQIMVILEFSHRVVPTCSYETSEQTFSHDVRTQKEAIT